MRRSEVQVIARMPQEPRLNFLGLVGGIAVQHQMDRKIGRNVAIDLVVRQNARRDSESELELFRAGNQQQRKGPGRAPRASVEANSRTWTEISRWKVFVSLFSTQLGRSGGAGRPALRAR